MFFPCGNVVFLGGGGAQDSTKQLRLFCRFEVLLHHSQSLFKHNARMNEKESKRKAIWGIFFLCCSSVPGRSLNRAGGLARVGLAFFLFPISFFGIFESTCRTMHTAYNTLRDLPLKTYAHLHTL